MSEKNRKYLAYLLILLGVAAGAFLIVSLLNRRNDEAPAFSQNTNIETENRAAATQQDSETNTSLENPENVIEEAEEKGFDNIKSIFRYDLYPEIEELLDAEKFDKELSDILLERGTVSVAAYEMPVGICLVTTTGYLTIDLENDVYLFDLMVDDSNNSVVSVVVSGDDYTFVIR